MSDNILVADSIVKRFGGLVAVDHVDFVIPRNSIVSIIGPTAPARPRSSTASQAFIRSMKVR